MNDVKESREREAKKAGLEVEEAVEEELPFWKVPHEDGDGYCLLLSAEVRLELFGLPGENRTLVVPVSETAEVEGKCLEGNSEVRFVWHDRHSEEENLINLVVERNTEMPNLVYLSGASGWRRLRNTAGGKTPALFSTLPLSESRLFAISPCKTTDLSLMDLIGTEGSGSVSFTGFTTGLRILWAVDFAQPCFSLWLPSCVGPGQ